MKIREENWKTLSLYVVYFNQYITVWTSGIEHPISAGLNPHHAPRDTLHIADLRPLPPTLVMICYYSKNLKYQLTHVLHDCFI